jgi:hypothetical protein
MKNATHAEFNDCMSNLSNPTPLSNQLCYALDSKDTDPETIDPPPHQYHYYLSPALPHTKLKDLTVCVIYNNASFLAPLATIMTNAAMPTLWTYTTTILHLHFMADVTTL